MPWAHPSKSFKFSGLDHDQTNLISFCVDLCETPNHALLQQLFYDLYRESRYTPQYLFMAPKDVIDLEREAYETIRQAPFEYLYLDMGNIALRKITSHATGHTIHIVPLPDLEHGSVILGFFK
jgi:hypothetical protein